MRDALKQPHLTIEDVERLAKVMGSLPDLVRVLENAQHYLLKLETPPSPLAHDVLIRQIEHVLIKAKGLKI